MTSVLEYDDDDVFGFGDIGEIGLEFDDILDSDDVVAYSDGDVLGEGDGATASQNRNHGVNDTAGTAPRTRGRPPGSSKRPPSDFVDGRLICSAKECPNPVGDLRTLVACSSCHLSWHAPCLQLAPTLANKLRARGDWQCAGCRTCAVCHCAPTGDLDALVACSDCDRAVHGHCASPPVRTPHRGYWNCNTTTQACAIADATSRVLPPRKSFKISAQTTSLPSIKRRGRAPRSVAASTGRGGAPVHAYFEAFAECPPGITLSACHPKTDHTEEKIHAIQTYEVPAADQDLFEKMCEQSALKADWATSKLCCVQLGDHNLYTWYASPYPLEFAVQPKIFLCAFCLHYFKTAAQLQQHASRLRGAHPPHPPGDEIYRKGALSIWEVDGRKHKLYAQNLCLLAKLFLDHKTLYYDVEPFLFYVLTEWEPAGAALVGYFSKEKDCFLNYNVSCIMTLPHRQRKGYGRMLIDFSYLLSRKEGKTGSPEKPLSDLGLLSYRRYWTEVILTILQESREGPVSIASISDSTALNAYDVISTLQSLGMIKYWRSKHVIVNNAELVNRYVTHATPNPATTLDPGALRWTPFVEDPAFC